MSKQSPQFTDELISAYLDGELSDEERQRVERVMEHEPRYRRMFEELQALRESLKTLPQYQLDTKFHERVLDRALRQTSAANVVPKPVEVSRTNAWRRFFWAGVTVAAALLIMLFARNVDEQKPIASNRLTTDSTRSAPPDRDSPVGELADSVTDERAARGVSPSIQSNSNAGGAAVDGGVVAGRDPSRKSTVTRALPGTAAAVSPPSPTDPLAAEDDAPFAAAIVADSLEAAGDVWPGIASETSTEAPVDAVIYFAKPKVAAVGQAMVSGYREGLAESAPESVHLVLARGTPEEIVVSVNQIQPKYLGFKQQPTTGSEVGSDLELRNDVPAGDDDQARRFRRLASPENNSVEVESVQDFAQRNDLFLDLDAEESTLGAAAATLSLLKAESDRHRELSRLIASQRGLDEKLPELARAKRPDGASERLALGIPTAEDQPARAQLFDTQPPQAGSLVEAARTPWFVVSMQPGQPGQSNLRLGSRLNEKFRQPLQDPYKQPTAYAVDYENRSEGENRQQLVDQLRRLQNNRATDQRLRVLFVVPNEHR